MGREKVRQRLCANLLVNAEGEEKVWRKWRERGGVFYLDTLPNRLVNLYTHTDGGVNCHARETYQRLGDNRERAEGVNGGSASGRK